MASWRVEVVHAGAQRSAGAKAVALLVWTGAGRTGNSWQAGGRDTCMQGVKFSRRKESISSGRSAFMSMEQGQQIIKKTHAELESSQGKQAAARACRDSCQ
jgi:hypothetical protein